MLATESADYHLCKFGRVGTIIEEDRVALVSGESTLTHRILISSEKVVWLCELGRLPKYNISTLGGVLGPGDLVLPPLTGMYFVIYSAMNNFDYRNIVPVDSTHCVYSNDIT